MKNKYLLGILEDVKKKDATEPEFIQTSLRNQVFLKDLLSLKDRLFSVFRGLTIMARCR